MTKNKSFNYQPRYYNPEMEDLHQRVEQAKRELAEMEEINPSVQSSQDLKSRYIPNIKGKMRKNLITQQYTQRSNAKVRGVIVLISVALIILIFYFILKFSGVFFING